MACTLAVQEQSEGNSVNANMQWMPSKISVYYCQETRLANFDEFYCVVYRYTLPVFY